jgi:hypothetical protein
MDAKELNQNPRTAGGALIYAAKFDLFVATMPAFGRETREAMTEVTFQLNTSARLFFQPAIGSGASISQNQRDHAGSGQRLRIRNLSS